MEATFGGTTLGSRKGTHFSTRDLEEMGHNFCDTLLDYCDPDTSKVDACYQEIQDRVKKQILKRMQMRNMQGNLGDVNLDDYSSEYESDTSGSDSSCDDRLPVHLLAIAPKLQRKRRLKSRRDRNKQMSRKSSAPNIQEDAKPTPSHGAKTIADKPKPIRYSQTAGSKRKEDHAHVSVGTTSHLSGFSEERATKKINRPLRTNRATFVQFSPPQKLITNAAIIQQQKINSSNHRTTNTQPLSSNAQIPTCVRTRSIECNKFRIEKYVNAVLSKSNEMSNVYPSDNHQYSDNIQTDGQGVYCDTIKFTNETGTAINLSPSMLTENSQILPEGMHVGELMKYSMDQQKQNDGDKKSTDEIDVVKLIQPKPNFQKVESRLFQPSMNTSNKMSKVFSKKTRVRPHTEPSLSVSSSPRSRNLPVIKEPARPPLIKSKTKDNFPQKVSPPMYWSHKISESKPQISQGAKPKFPSANLPLTSRSTKSQQEMLNHVKYTFNRIDFRQNNAYISTCSSVNDMSVEGDPVKPLEDKDKTMFYMLSKRSRALRKKIAMYDPKTTFKDKVKS